MHLEMTQGSTFVSNMNVMSLTTEPLTNNLLGLGFRLRKIMTRENVRNDAEYDFSCTHTHRSNKQRHTHSKSIKA